MFSTLHIYLSWSLVSQDLINQILVFLFLDFQRMSQAGDESSSSDEEELEVEKEQPICALAPTVYTRDERSTDVTSSPAFQCLDEVSCTLVFLATAVHIMSKSNK